jgi:tetratricopeptide (TPR) repeat protein
LLDHSAVNQATPEVIALADNTPPADAVRLKIAGQLLLRTQQWARAHEIYHKVLDVDRDDQEALAGAGVSAFELRQYAEALQDFDRLPVEQRDSGDVASAFDMSRRVLAVDPFLSGLSAEVRAQRAVAALSLAQTRFETCARQDGESLQETPPRTDLQKLAAQLQATQSDWNLRNLERFPERLDAAMGFVFNVENAATAACGEAQNDDRALWLLGHSRSMVNR